MTMSDLRPLASIPAFKISRFSLFGGMSLIPTGFTEFRDVKLVVGYTQCDCATDSLARTSHQRNNFIHGRDKIVGRVRREIQLGVYNKLLSNNYISEMDICLQSRKSRFWKVRGHLDIGKSGIRNPESGFRFFAGICLYWISLVSYSFLRYISCRISFF
jgi:hypothetical protein